KEINDTLGTASTLSNLGIIFEMQGNKKDALQHYLKALEIKEKLSDESGIVSGYINIGLFFYRQKNNEMALDYYQKAQKIILKALQKDSANIDWKQNLFQIYDNFGIIFADEGKEKEALENYQKALILAESIKNKSYVSKVCNNLGNLYKDRGDNSKALDYYQKSLKLCVEIGEQDGIAIYLINIGSIMVEKKEYERALDHLNQSLKIAKEIGNKKLIMEVYDKLADILSILGNNDQAYDFCRKYSNLRDSLLGEESQRQIAQMQVHFETDKKEKEIKILNQNKALQKVKNNRQRVIIYSTAAGVVLVLILALIIFRSFKKERKAKIIENKKNLELKIQKNKIEHQAKEITDSITYAQGIQEAILPAQSEFSSLIRMTDFCGFDKLTTSSVGTQTAFVLFKPKDVISGDFYWLHKVKDKGLGIKNNENDKVIFIAVADCTGHGVPGAILSMLGVKTLNEAVGISANPGEILSFLSHSIKKTLGKRNDGMDIALVKLRIKDQGLGIAQLEYSGANRPLWIVHKGATEIKVVEPDNRSIAGLTEENFKFKTNQKTLKSSDTFYIFSDGYSDQFGGPKGKKFMTRQLKELLVYIQDEDMEKQKIILNEKIEEWKNYNEGNVCEQVDDILIIGIRI
ncbi:MAG: tetratricopeptide repeat protein, partial [Patescibacteria group bacterium]